MSQKPDIRAITRLVPAEGNLVQGQSELPISPGLAKAAGEAILKNQNHYCASEGVGSLRRAVAAKIARNGITVNVDAEPAELIITTGGTGALVGIARSYWQGNAVLLFEPYYPYHRIIASELGSVAETMPLDGDDLALDVVALRRRCADLKMRSSFPLRAIVVCSPANPTGRIFSAEELGSIARICQELDLLCISDEVYEHFVSQQNPHISIASLPNMWERTITVNSFSKSWNISGWRLGYAYGPGKLIAPVNRTCNAFYVNSATPLQYALAEVLMSDAGYYDRMTQDFSKKREWVANELRALGFVPYESSSSFYVWAKIPARYPDANDLNQILIEKAQVAGVPGTAFSDSGRWDNYMRFCIAREEHILQAAVGRLRSALSCA